MQNQSFSEYVGNKSNFVYGNSKYGE